MKFAGHAPMDKKSVLNMQRAIARIMSENHDGSKSETSTETTVIMVKSQSDIDLIVAQKTILAASHAEELLFWQVLGGMVMKGNGPLDSIRKEVLSSIDKDHWENENDDHWLTLRNLEAAVTAY